MKRRDFLFALSGAIPSLLMAKEFLLKTSGFERWVWMHPNCDYSDDEWLHYLERFVRLGISHIHLEVYAGTKVWFKSSTPAEMPCDLLARILPLAKKAGLDVHAWIWTLMNDHSQVIKEHPDWYVVNRLGKSCIDDPPYVKYYRWLCPSKPQVGEFLEQVIKDLEAYPDLAGIHLDYIRFPDVILPVGFQPKYHLVQKTEMPQFDYCYCETCRSEFKKQSGFDPLTLPDPSKNQAWREFRENQITALVNRLSRKIRKQGKMVTAAVFPTPAIARRLVRQNWPQWDVDAFFPMMYHPFYHKTVQWLYEATQEGVRQINKRQKLYSGIYVRAFQPDTLARALHLIPQAGGAGVSFFDDKGLIANPALWPVLQAKGNKEK